MITLCQETKKALEPTQVGDLLTLLACHRRYLPAFAKMGDTVIETNGGTLIKVNGVAKTPHAVAHGFHHQEFDPIDTEMDWENPLVASIHSIKKSDTGFTALNEDETPITLLPITGVQQLYNADPNRFL